MNTRRKQGGITLLGFIIVAGVAGFFVFMGIKLFPMYQEYYSVKSALKGMAAEPGIGSYSPAKIQDLFFRRMNMSYASHIKKEHVKITRVDAGWQIEVRYEVREPMVGNLDAVGRFEATQLLSGSAPGN
ncbi:MAG TPA: DUF4845 domain-containing protein [Gammaproteobacteria bacterium]|nr:DUF4845 domain-containing protein [Luteimonas sp.]HRO27170.1 DUF4845 domain-containing protein [Luteimonas sp.]HRP36127.1 DUF4845 domain-containing protein [Gammaproteobacteria bacterium]HRP73399.1 DUF4845 domain-containing protein [Luteimonas sp.]